MKHFYCLTLFFIAINFYAQTISYKPGDKIDSSKTVTAISASSEFTWVGTDKGLLCVSKKTGKKAFYTSKTISLPSNFITSLCCRANGDLWIGTPKGIVLYDGYDFILIDSKNSKLPENFITSMKEDKNNNLWIGTRNSGLVKVYRNRFFIYNSANSTLLNNNICSIKTNIKDELVICFTENDSIVSSLLVKKN